MKYRRISVVSVVMITMLILFACSNNTVVDQAPAPQSKIMTSANEAFLSEAELSPSDWVTSVTDSIHAPEPPQKSAGQIFLYGEIHGNEKILEREIELWDVYYNKQGLRHLFVECPYYTAEFMNIWMQSDSNEILDALYSDWVGTPNHTLSVKEFYETIKREYPETVFHGTDIGHQYDTTGERYLEYLRSNDLEETEQYLITKEVIYQGKVFYKNKVILYRENMMVDNFIQEFDKLGGESVMGIYGAAHTGLIAMDITNSVPCMANQLEKRYGGNIVSEDLSSLEKDIDPYRVDIIRVAGKDYEASYYGKVDMVGFKDYQYREFWRLENAYDDFVSNFRTGEVLPYSNYPMLIEPGQVFVVDYTKTDGSVRRIYYRSDGKRWNGRPTTEAFIAE